MRLVDALITRTVIQTACCRSVTISSAPRSIAQYVRGSGRPDAEFALTLDSAPTSELRLEFELASVSCEDSSILLQQNVKAVSFLPSTITFSPAAKVLFASLVVRVTNTGCYVLSAWPSGLDCYSPANVSVSVTSYRAAPSTPC